MNNYVTTMRSMIGQKLEEGAGSAGRTAGGKLPFPSVDSASEGDLEEILQLQKLAYQSEAEIYDDFTLPPLRETLEDLREGAKKSRVLKVVEDGRIVGSVRGMEKDGTCYIGRLMVHPDYRNRGIGKKLLEAVERCFMGVRYELFTGHRSEKNLALYEKQGYKRFRTERVADHLQLVYMEKKADCG